MKKWLIALFVVSVVMYSGFRTSGYRSGIVIFTYNVMSLTGSADNWSINKNTNTTVYWGIPYASSDSIFFDSAKCVVSFQADSNIVDSIKLQVRLTESAYSASDIWIDGTNKTGTAGYNGIKWNNINASVHRGDKFRLDIWGDQMASNGDVRIYNMIFYGHYK